MVMRRILLSIVVLVLAAGACTRTQSAGEAPRQLPALPESSAGTNGDPIVRVIEHVRPAVVNITTEGFQQTPFGTQEGGGSGTGFVIRSDGIVVTNYHVVEGAHRIKVITNPPKSKQYDARVIGGDQTADLAVLKVEANNLPAAELGHSKDLVLGQPVVAIGYALALDGGPTVTTGIVSAMNRVLDVPDANCQECRLDPQSNSPTRTYRGVLQTDAAINPGNSGGPLVDLSGRVVGINTAGASAENIGFAISVDTVRPLIQEALANPGEPVAYLGIVSVDVTPDLALQLNLPVREGAYIDNVSPKGAAERAGIGSGDVVVEFDGKAVTGSEELGKFIRDREPGDRVDITFIDSGGDERTVTATLGVNPLP